MLLKVALAHNAELLKVEQQTCCSEQPQHQGPKLMPQMSQAGVKEHIRPWQHMMAARTDHGHA